MQRITSPFAETLSVRRVAVAGYLAARQVDAGLTTAFRVVAPVIWAVSGLGTEGLATRPT